MPLAIEAIDHIRANLLTLSLGHRAPFITIGIFTMAQFTQINATRLSLGLHPLERNEIVFMGRHLYNSRSADNYTIDDMLAQIESALGDTAEVAMSKFMSCLQSTLPRADGYGNTVYDRAVFEMTARKPRAELFSVIPKGDLNKPQKQ